MKGTTLILCSPPHVHKSLMLHCVPEYILCLIDTMLLYLEFALETVRQEITLRKKRLHQIHLQCSSRGPSPPQQRISSSQVLIMSPPSTHTSTTSSTIIKNSLKPQKVAQPPPPFYKELHKTMPPVSAANTANSG